jgi:hypothetical protein
MKIVHVMQCGNIVKTPQYIQDRWYESGCPCRFWGDQYYAVAIRVRNSDRWVVYDADSCVGYGFRYEYDARLFMSFWRNQSV